MMNKNLLSTAVGSAALLVTTVSLAVPFNSFDPKSMAMGGAGVAVANPATAPLFNPALLSVADKDDDFSLEFPIIGIRAYDPDDFIDAVDDFDDTVFDSLDSAISSFNADPLNSAKLGNVSTSIDNLSNEIQTISDKPMEFEGGGGIVIGIPGEKLGMAFSATANVNFSGIFEYEDAVTVDNLSSDIGTVAGCLGLAVTDITSCLNNASLNSGSVSVVAGNPVVSFNTDTDIQSKVQITGIAMAEVGLSFSREMAMFGTEVAVGITPKMVSVTVFDYKADADAADTDDFDGDDYTKDYSDFNMDIGIAMNHKNGWRSGFVIKNIISQDYQAMNKDNFGIEMATGTIVSLKPQARAGVSHVNGWSTVALDVDLTENEALGDVGGKSRYLALGVELNAFDWAQLRFGYRADTVNSDRNVMSAGIGVSPFGVHIDLGVAGNADEIGASLQLGFRF